MGTVKNNRGFTIVELLIVIVVIAVLAAISVVAYNGIQTRAKVMAIADELKKTEKGFRLLATEKGWSSWPLDNSSELTGTYNPQIASIITATNLKNYYPSKSPAVASFGEFSYDNDGDTYNGCTAANANGVNFFIKNIDQDLSLAIDKQIDDGNLNCGKITWSIDGSIGALRYNLSLNGSL